MARSRVWVNVYAIDRVYGGPEEGGWWYDIVTHVVDGVRVNRKRIKSAIRAMERKYPHTTYRYSVIPKGDDTTIMVENARGVDNRHLKYESYE